jgi:hypothetical protein
MVDGREMPCVRCTIDHELNAIPQASATIAVGRTFADKASPVHNLVSNFVDRAPAQIYITPLSAGPVKNSAKQSPDLGLVGPEVRIFDGFVTGAGFGRSRGSAQFTIQMENWLSEMAFSSIFSKSSHPGNPGQYSFGSLGPMGSQTGAFSNLSLGYEYFTAASVVEDFWGAALKPFLLELCKRDTFFYWDPKVGSGVGKNDASMAALNRFNSRYQQKLALDMTADLDIVSNIMSHASAAVGTPDILAQQTLWDVIIGTFCQEYLFYIVPRVEDAIAAPFIPGYRENHATITADESTQIEWTRGLGRPIRGVGILAGVQSATGIEMAGQPSPSGLGIGGYYTPGADAKGMIIIKKGPDWLTKLIAPARYAQDSSGAGGNVIGTAVNPGDNAPAAVGPPKPSVADMVSQRLTDLVRPFLNQYAQAHYALEKLRTRQAVCSGPFRLDIAPGTCVKVVSEGEKFIAGDPLAAPFYAHVARVSFMMDAEQGAIGTSFHLSHIRSEKENGDDKTSVARHPLYKNTFSGAPMIDIPGIW